MSLAMPSDTIATRLLGHARRGSGQPFLRLVQGDTSVVAISYEECLQRAACWAATFAQSGVRPRQRVVIILQNSLDLYAAFYGAMLADVVPALFAFPSPKFDEDEYFRTFNALIETASPALVVSYPELAPKIRGALAAAGQTPGVCTPDDLATATALPSPTATGDDVAFVQYSSGTTGTKKGVAVSHRAALWQVDTYARAIGLRDDDLIASWLPLYHDMGLVACCLLPFVTGTPLLSIAPHDWVRAPLLLLHMIGVHRATLCWLPNFAYSFMAKNIMPRELEWLNLSTLRGLINCSEPIMADSHRTFVARFAQRGFRADALGTSYAMAETTFAVTSGGLTEALREDVVDRSALAWHRAVAVDAAHEDATVLVSSGQPLPDTTITIRSATGALLPDRTIGEIVVSSPSAFQGYERNPEATKTALRSGVVHTGDLGYVAEGHLFVTGRLKDLLIISGRNLHPHDVEDVVQAVPGVIAGRCAAFGVADAASGTERLVVVAETHEASAEGRERMVRSIIARVAGRMDVAPADVRLVPPRWLVKSTSGKMARDRNRQRYLAELATLHESGKQETPAAPDRLALTDLDRALGCVRRVLHAAGRSGAGDVGADDRLVTTGLVDSLTLVALVVEVEKAFGITIPATRLDVGHFNTARHIATLVGRPPEDSVESLHFANGVTTSDDRDKVCERLLECADAVDLVVIGSSKAKHLAPQVAAEFGCTGFNFWLRNAHAEDWYAAASFAIDHAPRLRSIVLVVDIESLSNATGSDLRLAESVRLRRYLSDSTRLERAEAVDGVPGDRFRTVFVQYKLGQHEPWTWALAGRGERYTERTGAMRDATGRPACTIRDAADSDAQYTLRMRNFTALDAERLGYFHRLLERCFAAGIAVRCCVAPLHQHLDRQLSLHTTYAARLDEFVAIAQGIDHPLFQFDDTRTPERFGGNRDDFVNAAHIGYDNADRLLRFLLADRSVALSA